MVRVVRASLFLLILPRARRIGQYNRGRKPAEQDPAKGEPATPTEQQKPHTKNHFPLGGRGKDEEDLRFSVQTLESIEESGRLFFCSLRRSRDCVFKAAARASTPPSLLSEYFPPESTAIFAFGLHFLLNTDGRPIGAEDLSVKRNQQTPVQNIFKGGHDAFIQRRAS